MRGKLLCKVLIFAYNLLSLFYFQVKVTFEDFSAGSRTTMKLPDDESQKTKETITTDDEDRNMFEGNSAENLHKLLNPVK